MTGAATPLGRPGPARTALLVASMLLALVVGATRAGAAPVVPDGGVVVKGSLEEKKREVDAARAVGIRWTSHSIWWAQLEPTRGGHLQPGTPGADRLELLREELAYAKSRGMSVELRLNNAPAWASGRDATNDPPTPANLAAYGDFLGDLGRRLGPYIDAYSPWNEPNLGQFWAAPDPVAYTRLQQQAYRSLKAADPDALVLSAPIYGLSRGYEYLERAYQAGLAGSADRIGWNAYPLAAPEEPYRDSSGRPDASSLPGQLYLRTLIDRYDPGRKVWLMETSWSTCPDCPFLPQNSVSEAQQADYLVRAFAYRRQYLTGVTERLFWYQLRDGGSNRRNWEHNQGLLRRDFSPKPAYAAMRSVAVEEGVAPAGGGTGPGGGAAGPGAEAVRPLPAAAARPPLPPRAVSRRGRVAIGRLVVVARRGYLVATTRVVVRGGASRVRVEAFRRGRWQSVASARLARTSRVRVRFIDRAYAGVRIRATVPGRTGFRASRVARVRR